MGQFDWWDIMALSPFSWMRWTGYVSVATAFSFVPLSIVTFLGVVENWAPWIQFVVIAIFGIGQGAIIGFGQSLAMRKTDVSVPLRGWISASALGAGALWILGQLPGYFIKVDLTNVYVSFGAILIALVVFACFGFVQYRILKGRVTQAWRWIIITAFSWLLGLLIFAGGGLLAIGDGQAVRMALFLSLSGTIGVVISALLTGLGLKLLSRDSIANPRFGSILPDTPRVNAVKRKVARAKNKARERSGEVAGKAWTKVKPVVRKRPKK